MYKQKHKIIIQKQVISILKNQTNLNVIKQALWLTNIRTVGKINDSRIIPDLLFGFYPNSIHFLTSLSIQLIWKKIDFKIVRKKKE